MKKIIGLLILLCEFSGLYSQSPRNTGQTVNDSIYTIVDRQPRFQFGDVYAWLYENIIYPPDAVNRGAEGKAEVSFVVEKNGTVSNISLLEGTDSDLNREALKVVSRMPLWIPGRLRKEPVRVRLMLPVIFKLTDKSVADREAYRIYYDSCVQKPPVFAQDLKKYLEKHMAWSQDALDHHAHGKIVVEFIVELDGSVSNINILKCDRGAALLRDNAMQVISEMTNHQKWLPGYIYGHQVRVKKAVTFDYVLDPDKDGYKVYAFDK
jgi:TonB family protein